MQQPTRWEGKPGGDGQCATLQQAIALDFRSQVLRVSYRGPWQQHHGILDRFMLNCALQNPPFPEKLSTYLSSCFLRLAYRQNPGKPALSHQTTAPPTTLVLFAGHVNLR